MASFLDGDDQILTLKDTGVLENEEEGDELENVALREHENLQERLDLKKKRPVYDPNDVDDTGEIGLLSKYDEEIHGKEKGIYLGRGSGYGGAGGHPRGASPTEETQGRGSRCSG